MEYTAYTLSNFTSIPQIRKLPEEQRKEIEVVGQVLPFKSNNYVVEHLINWKKVPDDPMFILTFPQREMLPPGRYEILEKLIVEKADEKEINTFIEQVRLEMNPHPAGQIEHNVPVLGDDILYGMQHKYSETVLFFPSQGQTCHAYCTFCFRWPQFVGMDEFKFATKEADLLVQYIAGYPEITDVLFTGGDPLIMSASLLAGYIEPLLESGIPNLRNIRIGTRALSYWPYRFTEDDDADDLLELFRKVRESGKHLAFMAQFNHPIELENDAVQAAIRKIQETGAVIRTQSPLLKNINDSSEIWSELWQKQVGLGCVPYYMFVVRNTGAHHYFSVPLVRAWEIYQNAYKTVSGISRTARGPVMSCLPGKIQVLGPTDIKGEKVLGLRMIQGRSADWADYVFFAEYDEEAIWYRDLKPAFGEEKFFFEDELSEILKPGEFESDYE
jgi:KamA family protein